MCGIAHQNDPARRMSKAGIALNLAGVASVAEAQARSELAVRLFEAAEFLREVLGYGWDTFDEIETGRNTIAKRTHLDDITFTAMWAEGRALPLEQAIAEALNAMSRAPTSSHLPAPGSAPFIK